MQKCIRFFSFQNQLVCNRTYCLNFSDDTYQSPKLSISSLLPPICHFEIPMGQSVAG